MCVSGVVSPLLRQRLSRGASKRLTQRYRRVKRFAANFPKVGPLPPKLPLISTGGPSQFTCYRHVVCLAQRYTWRACGRVARRGLSEKGDEREMTQHDARTNDDQAAQSRQRKPPTRARPTRPASPKRPDRREQRSIGLTHGPLEYTLRTSGRARRVRLVVQPGGALEVVAPHGAALARVEAALREHEAWIVRTRERLARVAPVTPPQPLAEGRVLACAGRSLRLGLRSGAPQGRFHVRVDGDQLTLTLPQADEALARAALERWYRRQAHTIVAERLAHWNTHYGFSWTRVAIKEQKTRWGSCSRQGALNFNWRLLLAPLPILDYVVIHELCHLKEPNHAPRFWALVAQTCPDYRERRGWLRQHGHELRL